jgi:hypothetical protein
MADKPVVHIGENSPEHVAYQLMRDVQAAGAGYKLSADQLLDLYAECLLAVIDPRSRGGTHKKTQPRSGFER